MDRNLFGNRIFFIVVFLLLIVLAYFILRPFLTTIVLALTTIIVLKPLYGWILKQRWIKGRARIAASLTLLSVFVMIVVPAYFLGRVFIDQISLFVSSIDLSILETLNLQENVRTVILESEATLQSSVSAAVGKITGIGASLLQLFVSAMIFVVIFIVLMPEFDNLVELLEGISPLGKDLSRLYYRKTTAMISSLFKGIFIIAILQGSIMGFFYWLAGIQLWFILMILSMFLAVLPIVGISWLVILLSVIAVLQGNVTTAVIILIGFYGVANWVDVFLRPRLVSKEAYLNFALVLLGILGGVAWAGFLGLFYGPVILLLLVTTIQIYGENFASQDAEALQEIILPGEAAEG